MDIDYEPCPKCGLTFPMAAQLRQPDRHIKAGDRFLHCSACSFQLILPPKPIPTYRVEMMPEALEGTRRDQKGG